MDNLRSGLGFSNPLELFLLLDDDFREGEVSVHPWQARGLGYLAKPCDDSHPLEVAVQAANGSGKSRLIVAPFAAWHALEFIESRTVITSASGGQLDLQTAKYIRMACAKFNAKYGREVFTIQKRIITVAPSREGDASSEIIFFATDEGGKAEGWHPIAPGRSFAIITDETKSILPEITDALERCTGYSYRLDVSSPGPPQGYFWKTVNNPKVKTFHIDAFQCPHISREHIEKIKFKYGESSALYRSMVLALFTNLDNPVVVTLDKIDQLLLNLPPWIKETYNRAGIDLSAGRDETVLQVANGNKHLHQECWNFTDTAKTVEHLDNRLTSYGCTKENSEILADAGGLGKPILDQLRKKGWKRIYYLNNQETAWDSDAYANFGSEAWGKTGRLVEELCIIPLLVDGAMDPVLKDQLANRHYKFISKAKIQVLSKLEEKAQGMANSPDRADAFNLLFHRYKLFARSSLEIKPKPTDEYNRPKPKSYFRSRDLAKHNIQYRGAGDVGREYTRLKSNRNFTQLREEIEAYNSQLVGKQ